MGDAYQSYFKENYMKKNFEIKRKPLFEGDYWHCKKVAGKFTWKSRLISLRPACTSASCAIYSGTCNSRKFYSLFQSKDKMRFTGHLVCDKFANEVACESHAILQIAASEILRWHHVKFFWIFIGIFNILWTKISYECFHKT